MPALLVLTNLPDRAAAERLAEARIGNWSIAVASGDGP